MTKLKPYTGKARQSVQNCLNLNLVIGSILENGFEATLSYLKLLQKRQSDIENEKKKAPDMRKKSNGKIWRDRKM